MLTKQRLGVNQFSRGIDSLVPRDTKGTTRGSVKMKGYVSGENVTTCRDMRSSGCKSVPLTQPFLYLGNIRFVGERVCSCRRTWRVHAKAVAFGADSRFQSILRKVGRMSNGKSACGDPILGLRASWKQFQETCRTGVGGSDVIRVGDWAPRLFKRAGISVEQGRPEFDLRLLANSALCVAETRRACTGHGSHQTARNINKERR
jgi:hypothetical protein